MSLLERMRQIRNLSLTDPKAWNPTLWNLRGAQSISGENVTEATAFTYSAFWNAITLISGTTASLPLNLMQKQDKTRRIADEKRVYTVMHDQANPWMTAMAFRETMMSHILTWGNGYAEIVRNGFGEIIALWPISPDRITKMEMKDGELIYTIQVPLSEQVTLPRAQILHIPGLGYDGYQGYSVVAMARKSIGLGMAMETFGARYFGAGTHPDLILSHPNALSEPARKNIKDSFIEYNSGLSQSHRLMLLEEAMTVEKIGIPPNESQFLESRVFEVSEIARWFNLPPHKLKDLSKSSFNNIESEQISFVTDSILPWLIRLEQNYKMQLLTPREQKELFYWHHVVEGLLRGNAKDRALYYKIMRNIGAITANEVRAKENMDPDPNPLADELWVMMNMVPLSQYEEFMKSKINQSNPSEPSEGTEDNENENQQ